MRLYANENFPFPDVAALRQRGHDVLTVQETGRGERVATDAEVLDFACREQRALLTLNRKHFIRLHTARPQHAGIIVCTFDPDFEQQAQRINSAIAAQPELAGQLMRVNRPEPVTFEAGVANCGHGR